MVDEAHLFVTEARAELLRRFEGSTIPAVTATPARGDGRGLGGLWDVLIEGPDIAELIDSGHLVSCRYFAPSTPNLAGVTVRRRDYAAAELSDRMVELVADIVPTRARLASVRSRPGRRRRSPSPRP